LPRPIRQASAKPEEMVSISSTVPFDQAMQILSEVSKKFSGKIIIDEGTHTSPIGVQIEKMHWLDALESILYTNKLWYQEFSDHLSIIVPKEFKEPEEVKVKIDTVGLVFSTREVVISAIFFEANVTKMRQVGFSWTAISPGGDSAAMTAADNKSGLFEYKVRAEFDFGNLFAIFKTLENNQVGEILASPQVTVMSKQEGLVQIGSDFSITTQDFAGNTVTSFFSTGSIIRVTPVVFSYDTLYFIHLTLDVQKSSANTSEIGTEIKKSSAKTDILLLDGEQTIIGGLYSNEDNNIREGVPFLKDLPWWFLGLRYLFGYETKSFVRKELIILLKADLLPSLAERAQSRIENLNTKSALEEFLKERREKLEPKKD
jgi:type IV pilus assembly protein PilQ